MKKNKLLLCCGILVALVLLFVWLSASKTSSKIEKLPPKTAVRQINSNVFMLDAAIFKSGKTNTVNLGIFAAQGNKKIKMTNLAPEAMLIEEWRSTCDCLEINGMPERLEPGKTTEIEITVYPDGYSGEITKIIPLLIRYEKKKKTLFMTLKFTATESSIPKNNVVKTISPSEMILYAGGGLDDGRYTGAKAWLLGGKNCSSCNWVKKLVLPELLAPQPRYVRVYTDDEEGLKILLVLEEKLNIKEPGDAPVLYFNNKLYYGTEAIKELLEKHNQIKKSI